MEKRRQERIATPLRRKNRQRVLHGRDLKVSDRLRFFDHSAQSVMIRNLDGSICFWNKAAERHYGWSYHEAIGHVSHRLLSTVFPLPLSEINAQLLAKGFWEGELIHTISDGVRVRVQSRWELDSTWQEGAQAVVETNKVAEILRPETSHFQEHGRGTHLLMFFWEKRWWIITPFVVLALLVSALVVFTYEKQLMPLMD